MTLHYSQISRCSLMFFNAPDDDTTTLSLVVLVLVLVLMLVVVVVVVLVVVVVAVAAAALVDALALFALRVASSSIKSLTPHQQIQRDFVLLLPVFVRLCLLNRLLFRSRRHRRNGQIF